MSIDWSKPLECYHEDGRVEPVIREESPTAEKWIVTDHSRPHIPTVWNNDGTPWMKKDDGWTIRNVQPDTSDLTARMEKLVREMAGSGAGFIADYRTTEEARAIVALLPPVVDADLVEARKLCAKLYNPQWAAEEWPLLENEFLRAIAKAIKHGRALERGE